MFQKSCKNRRGANVYNLVWDKTFIALFVACTKTDYKNSIITFILRFQFSNYFLILRLFTHSLVKQPTADQSRLILEVSKSHTQWHKSQYDSSGQAVIPSQKFLPDTTKNSNETNIDHPSGVRTRGSGKQSAADPRLRPLGYRDRLRFLKVSNITLN